MKKILCLLVLMPFIVNAQRVKKVQTKSQMLFAHSKEVFYVLKSDKKTRHGSYTKYAGNEIAVTGHYKNGLLDSTWTYYSSQRTDSIGSYKNGLKHGTWTTYDRFGKKISSGAYDQGKKTGAWDLYDRKGVLEQTYDYTLKSLTFLNADTATYKVFIGIDTLKTKLERSPAFVGGSREMVKYIAHEVKYPEKAIENEISGKSVISFIIDEDGKASGHRVSVGFDSECDAEALRVIKQLPNSWYPALLNGKAVAVEMKIPLTFTAL